jgi:hypothetical protein
MFAFQFGETRQFFAANRTSKRRGYILSVIGSPLWRHKAFGLMPKFSKIDNAVAVSQKKAGGKIGAH